MKLALQVLDGPHKGSHYTLRTSLVLGRQLFNDPEMAERHAGFEIDSNYSWKINGLGENMIRAGFAEAPSFSLIQGFVFHIGQTGFKVVEAPEPPHRTWEKGLVEHLESHEWLKQRTDFFFFLFPVRLTFLQGPQTDEFYTLSYGPRTLGFNHLDINIIDPTQPNEIVRFTQVGESLYLENLGGDDVKINGSTFKTQQIISGDRLSFGINLVELTFLR